MPLWLDRTLFRGPHLCLVMSDKEYRAALQEFDLADDGVWLEPRCRAVTHTFEKTRSGTLICILAMGPDALKRDAVDVAASIAHESVHVWQRVRDFTSLENPMQCWGREAEAYAIENIFRAFADEFKRRLSSPPPPLTSTKRT